MSNNGWIKIHRKLQRSPMYQNLNSKQRDVMMQVLMMASHEETEWEWQGEVCKIQPGQFVTSLDSIRQACGKDVKVQSVRTALLKLEKWHFLTNEATKHGRLITVVKWGDYQGDEVNTNKEINKEPTKLQQSSNKELTSIKNVKNNKRRIINNSSPVKSENFTDNARDLSNYFSKTLPNKNLIPKTQAQKAKWLKCFDDCHRLDGYSYDQIRQIVEYFRNDEWWRSKFLSPLKLRKTNRDGVKYIDLFWTALSEEGEKGMDNEALKVKRANIAKMKKWGWSAEKIRENYPDYVEK